MDWKKRKKDTEKELWRANCHSLAGSVRELTGLIEDLLDVATERQLDADEAEGIKAKTLQVQYYAELIEAETSKGSLSSAADPFSLKELSGLVQEPPP